MSIPGLPALPAGVSVLADVALLAADLVTALLGQSDQQWGLFLDGSPAVVADSVVAFEIRDSRRVTDAPLEGGAFESYNKVKIPFQLTLRFAAGGSFEARQDLLDSIIDILDSLELFDAVTPERTYESVNPVDYDFRRTATDGQGLLIIDLHCRLINVTAESDFGDAQSPSAAAEVDNGQQQAQQPSGTITVTPTSQVR